MAVKEINYTDLDNLKSQVTSFNNETALTSLQIDGVRFSKAELEEILATSGADSIGFFPVVLEIPGKKGLTLLAAPVDGDEIIPNATALLSLCPPDCPKGWPPTASKEE